jgi:hypothetical protein
MRFLKLSIFALLLFSCIKQKKYNEPKIGFVEIDSTMSPKTVAVGENIVSKVRLVRGSIGGEFTFLGFEVTESPSKVFSIRAKALYKDWEQMIILPVYKTIDTSTIISTRLAGPHILKFYNANNLFKSDTVQVN